jgi:hypothetical protein
MELPNPYIVAAILKIAAGLKSGWAIMVVENNEVWHIEVAASYTILEASTLLVPPRADLFEEASTLEENVPSSTYSASPPRLYSSNPLGNGAYDRATTKEVDTSTVASITMWATCVASW